jgi:transposase
MTDHQHQQMSHPSPLLPAHLPDPYMIGSSFATLEAAKDALIRYTLARGLSYKVRSSEKRRYIVLCRSNNCPFRIRINTTDSGAKVTISEPHTCPVDTHYDWRPPKSLKSLLARQDPSGPGAGPGPETESATTTTAAAPTKKKWTTRDERIRINTLAGIGWSQRKIASHLGLSLRQVHYACSTEEFAPKKPRGRRSLIGEEELDRIEAFICASEENRRMSYKRIIEAMDLKVSVKCLGLALKKRGYSSSHRLAKATPSDLPEE